MLLALSAGQKTGLALVGAAFIVFALASALVIPRFRPDFPGRRVGLFAAVAVLFTVAMLAAVIGFGKESEPEAAGGTSVATTTATIPATSPSTTTSPPASGDPAAGKAVFTGNGCAGCHTYGPAGSAGTIGPNLGQLAADAQKANQGNVADYTKTSIVDPGSYVVPGFPSGVMPPDYRTRLSPQQIDDLVAFLTQG